MATRVSTCDQFTKAPEFRRRGDVVTLGGRHAKLKCNRIPVFFPDKDCPCEARSTIDSFAAAECQSGQCPVSRIIVCDNEGLDFSVRESESAAGAEVAIKFGLDLASGMAWR